MKKKTKVFFEGFKAFITKGNILDLAVAFIVGGAFRAIITSLVNDIIMPLFTSLTGEQSFSDLVWILNNSEIRYGAFIQAIVEFLIIAFSLYAALTLVIRRQKFLDQVEQGEKPVEKVIPEDIKLLTEIRDQLKEINEK